ncbi:MAG: hypothetical protein HKM89_01360 [Gemmatimonadales bacterium]|nr:hypothetical protein [Gemmatimonadales bacterium]
MIIFHRFLIGTAILFAAGFAVWSFGTYRSTGQLVHLVLGVLAALAVILFGYYLKHLQRFLHR